MSEDNCCKTHGVQTSSVFQTIQELEFERGIWNFAMYGEIDKLKEKLDKGIDPSVCDSSGYTALHYAARNGKEAACVLLLERGASPNAQTPGGATPLHRAAYQGHINIVRLLLKCKADPTLCDTDGKTALHKVAEGSCKEGSHTDVARVLLENHPALKCVTDKNDAHPFTYVNSEKKELLALLSCDIHTATGK